MFNLNSSFVMSDEGLTVPPLASNVIVKLFTMDVNLAVYVAEPVTVVTSGVHPSNLYVYCAVAAFFGSSPLNTGVEPYSASVSVSRTVPSSLAHVITYSLVVHCA